MNSFELSTWQRGALHRAIGVPVLIALAAMLGALSGCSSTGGRLSDELDDPSSIPDAIPKVEPKSKYGNPASYMVFGKRYYTKGSSKNHSERGVASWYGKKFHGRKTSSGEVYDMYAMTAAHKTLPLPTYARVTNVVNGRSAVVKINDRGPFHGNRVIDLSYSAARKLGVIAKGTAMVDIEAIDPSRPSSGRRNHFLASKTDTAKHRANKRLAASKQKTVKAGRSNNFLDLADGPMFASRQAPAKADVARRTPAAATALKSSIAAKAPAATEPEPMVLADSMPRPEKTPAAKPASQNTSAPKPVPAPRVALATAEKRPEGDAGSALYLQVGAFGQRSNAEQLRRRLADNIAESAQVRMVNDAKMALYKVRVGPLASRATATDLSQRLASLGLTGSHIVLE